MTWPTVVLSDVAAVVGGSTPKTGTPEFWDGDVAWVTPKELSGLRGTEIVETERTITETGLKASGAQLLPAGAVLLSSRAPIGHTAIVGTPMATNQGFKSLIPDSERLDSRYLLRWLRWKRPEIEALGTGATFKEVSKRVVERIPIGLPPLEEQRRIADVLDRADALRAKRRETLTRLDELTQSIFADMFEHDEPAAHLLIEDLLAPMGDAIRTGPFGSQLLVDEFVASGVPVLGIDNVVTNEFEPTYRRFVTTQKFDKLRRYAVRPGDLLVTIMGTCGRVAIVPDDVGTALNTKHLCCITLDPAKCAPEFLRAYLLWDSEAGRHLGRQAKGAIMSGLNMGIIRSVPVRLPSLERQHEFVERESAVRAAHAGAARSLAQLDELFASLQQRAFRGDLFSSPLPRQLADAVA